MTDLPPRARLEQILTSLAARLPEQMVGLLDAPRFADGAAALRRLADPAYAREAIAAMTDEEAAWMADRLLQRWSNLAPAALDPVVAITAPSELWIGDRPVRVPLAIATSGVDPDWDAVWDGAVVPGPPAQTAVLLADPPSDDRPAVAIVRARVRARANGRRCVLVAEARVRLRRPQIDAREGARRLVLRDHTGEPGAFVEIEVGPARYTTDATGAIELPKPLALDASIRVSGAIARLVSG